MFTLDSYAARSCPLKTHHAFHPGIVRPEPPLASTIGQPGAADFVSAVCDRIIAAQPGVVDLRGLAEPSAAQEAACLAAMAAGAPVILGGLLPRDPEGHRSGRAPVLVRDPSGGYFPGLVKLQRLLDARRDDHPFSCSVLDRLAERREMTGWRYRWNWRSANALQLAHLWRLLTHAGQQAASGPIALVIGNDEPTGEGPVAVWLDLDATEAPPSPRQVSGGAVPVTVSALARYDAEFAARVQIAEQAAAASPTDPPLLQPVVSHECGYCPWWPVCRPMLADDDLSLRLNKTSLDPSEITALRELGVSTVAELAAGDLAALLPAYLPRVAHRPAAEDRLRLAQRRCRLLAAGLELERITEGPIDVPRAQVEIDIDVETSRDDRVYLWGFWVAGPDGGHYHQVSSFAELDDAAELALASQAMAWLRDQVAGADALVFHYSDYEVVRLRRLAEAAPDEALTWAVSFAEERFVDLFSIVRQHFFGANGLSLKVVARAGAGFNWRDEEPGGLNSMGWHLDAQVESFAGEQARTRLLEYNEDDVRATCQLRRWLREQR